MAFARDPSLTVAQVEIVERDSELGMPACSSLFDRRVVRDRLSRFRRRDRTGAAGNQPIMLDATVTGEVEDGLLSEGGRVEIARMQQKLVALGTCLCDDLAIGIDDQAASNEREAVLDASLRDSHDPRRVLIRTGLHGQTIVEQPLLRTFLAFLGIDRGRIVAEQDHLHALQTHDAIRLRPAPVVADRHAEDAVHRAPDTETQIARLEITLLKMLEGTLGVEFRMARQMNLAYLPTIFADLSVRRQVLK